jgi:Arc/MetJ family transcription regulator
VRKTTVEVDDDKIAEAAALLGTRTLKETIERSLDQVIAFAARRRLIDHFSRPNDLLDPEVARLAWRE